jgi:putative ABC transport system permease protein
MASVALSVGLVVAVFSMIDALVAFERADVERKEGSYHILVRNASGTEAAAIARRGDIECSGYLFDLGKGSIHGSPCAFAAVDEAIAGRLIFRLSSGRYPRAADEVMVEEWTLRERKLGLGDSLALVLPSGEKFRARIVGSMEDSGATKAAAIPAVFVSPSWASAMAHASADCFIRFKSGVNPAKAEASIAAELGLSASRIGRNEGLLALSLESMNNRVLTLYAIGAFLFLLVLVTAVVMISNVFNISVLDRVRQFGLLRCVGASAGQVRRLVRREGLAIAGIGVPVGLALGELFTLGASLFLKYVNGLLFGSMRAFSFSILGAIAGTALGFLTVLFACRKPASMAARVSPLSALGGGQAAAASGRGGRLRFLPVELRMGLANALRRRKSFVLMSASMALGVVLFLGFNVLVNPAFLGMKTTKAYTADISLSSAGGFDPAALERLRSVKGVASAWGRKAGFASASFEPSRIDPDYARYAARTGKPVALTAQGLATPERSRLLSLDSRQLAWAKAYIAEGVADEKSLNAGRGVIAVRKSYRADRDAFLPSLEPRLGDRISVERGGKTSDFVVMAIADSLPYSTDEASFTTLATTEGLFDSAMGPSPYSEIDLRLSGAKPDAVVAAARSIAGPDTSLGDRRQHNAEGDSAFLTVAVFIYGFMAVIGLIAALNVANTMNTSVAARTRYFGTLRAIGLSGAQLRRMVLAEAGLYCATGLAFGGILGLALQRAILGFLKAAWAFPAAALAIALCFALVAAALSVRGPLRRLRCMNVPEALASL